MQLEKISFHQILPIWRDHLWPERVSEITPTSAMCYLGGYDLVSMDAMPTFFAYMIDGEIAGVNSGHMCKDNAYRSSGLYVFEKFRGMRIGTKLLTATIEQGRKENAHMCWSYPRDTSWKTYSSAEFLLDGEFSISETGNNAYCYYYY